MAFLFCYYLVGILTMTGIHAFKLFSPKIVFIPFLDMINSPTDTLLNALLFFPMGIFLPLLYRAYNRIGKIASTSFFLALSIEIAQMFGMGTTDINDLIANTLGACLGYCFYKLLFLLLPKKICQNFQAREINDCAETLFYIIYAFAVMVTVQPFLIHKLFRLG